MESMKLVEPILELPLGTIVLMLLLLVCGAMLLVFLLTRRRYKASAKDRIAHSPWLEALLEGLPQAVLIVGPDGDPMTWNTRMARLLTLDYLEQDKALPFTTLVERVLETGITETIELTIPDYPGRHLRVTASRLEERRSLFGVLLTAFDPAETTGRIEFYCNLVSAMSHELQTPLTAVLGHTEILRDYSPREQALRQRSLDYIARETQRLARLVEDLLTLSRLGLTPLQRRPTNLRAVAEEAIVALFQSAEQRGVQLSLQSPMSLSRVLGDRDRIQQVFLNLLDNAIKYSKTGGKVIVNLTPEEDKVRVGVWDDGVGIGTEDLPYILDPFYRGENAHSVSGTGLGLTIVRTILEQHDADLEVQSTPEHGTTFGFCLPVPDAQA